MSERGERERERVCVCVVCVCGVGVSREERVCGNWKTSMHNVLSEYFVIMYCYYLYQILGKKFYRSRLFLVISFFLLHFFFPLHFP